MSHSRKGSRNYHSDSHSVTFHCIYNLKGMALNKEELGYSIDISLCKKTHDKYHSNKNQYLHMFRCFKCNIRVD